MRFVLIDRILDVQRGESLVAVKNLSLAEEYLSDHFPGFPVMPGVLMLEAIVEAGAWLVRVSDEMAHSMVTNFFIFFTPFLAGIDPFSLIICR